MGLLRDWSGWCGAVISPAVMLTNCLTLPTTCLTAVASSCWQGKNLGVADQPQLNLANDSYEPRPARTERV